MQLASILFSMLPLTAGDALSESGTSRLRLMPEALVKGPVSVHASNYGRPWVWWDDGYALVSSSAGTGALLSEAAPEPRTIAAGDFDGDGIPDLVAAYADAHGGRVTLLPGNADAIYPNTPGAQQRRAEATFTAVPFLAPSRVVEIPEAPDFLGTGDFNNDGHLDLVAAAAGSATLYLLPGDGHWNLGPAQAIALPGTVTAMVTGDANRADGLTDIAIGIQASDGPAVLVYESPQGALWATPERLPMPAPVTDLALGRLGSEYPIDLAVAAGNEVLIIHQHDRRLSVDQAGRAAVPPAVIESRKFPFAVEALAVADLVGDYRDEIAILADDGTVSVLGGPGEPSSPLKNPVPSERAEDLVLRAGGADLPMSACPMCLFSEDSYKTLLGPIDRRTAADPVLSISGSSPRFQGTSSAHSELGERRLHLLQRAANVAQGTSSSAQLCKQPPALADWWVAGMPPPERPTGRGAANGRPRLVRTRASILGKDDLVVVDPAAAQLRLIHRLHLLPSLPPDVAAQKRPRLPAAAAAEIAAEPVTLDVDGSPVAVLPMRLNRDALSDLVVLKNGAEPLAVVLTAASSTFVVDSSGDESDENTTDGLCRTRVGTCTFRAAIEQANASPGMDEITFAVDQITPATQLPHITDPVVIDGALPAGMLELSGTEGGLFFSTGNSVVRNMVINGALESYFQGGNPGIWFWPQHGEGGSIVESNYLGTDVSGTVAVPNTNGVGISDSNDNLVGGTAAAARNLLSGNGMDSGVTIDGACQRNRVIGNLIGTDVTGQQALGNMGSGVLITAASDPGSGIISYPSDNVVENNVIVATAPVTPAEYGAWFLGSGVLLFQTAGNLIQQNFIGTDATGNSSFGNYAYGVLSIAPTDTRSGNTVQANTIAFNGADGVLVMGPDNVGNRVSGNAIFSNAGLGINLSSAEPGPTSPPPSDTPIPNDHGDADSGANKLQNYPVVSVDDDGTTIHGSLDSTPNTTFSIELFANSACDPSGYGQGETFLGALSVTTGANGLVQFTAPFAAPVGKVITATATDPSGNTSEFSPCAANSILLTPQLLLGLGLCGATPQPIKLTEFASGQLPRDITTDSSVTYEWVGAGLDEGLLAPVLSALQLASGVTVPKATITVQNGTVTFQSNGINILRARKGPRTSNYALLIGGGLDLAKAGSLEIEPESLANQTIIPLADRLTTAFGAQFPENAPMLLFPAGPLCSGRLSFVGTTGLVAVKSIKFDFFGGHIKGVDLMQAVKDIIGLLPDETVVTWLISRLARTAAPLVASQFLDFEVSSKAKDGDGGTRTTEDPVIKVSDTFPRGVVSAKQAGLSAVQATLDLTNYCLGKASDTMLVWVLPQLERVDIRNEDGFVEEPLTMSLQSKPHRQPHTVGIFSGVAAGSSAAVILDPLGGSSDEQQGLIKELVPGGTLPPGIGVQLSVKLPSDAPDPLPVGIYEGGNSYFKATLRAQINPPSIILSELRLQTTLPDVTTAWSIADPNIATTDGSSGYLSAVHAGDTQLGVDVCIPFFSPSLSHEDHNGVHVGSGLESTSTPTRTATRTPTRTATQTPTLTASATRSATNTPTRTVTATASRTATTTSTPTPTPGALTLRPHLIMGLGGCISTSREIEVKDSAGRILTTDKNISYEWIDHGLERKVAEDLVAALSQKVFKGAITLEIATITVADGAVTFHSKGINVLRAKLTLPEGVRYSNFALVLGASGDELATATSLEIEPLTLISGVSNSVTSYLNQAFRGESNPVMLLFTNTQVCGLSTDELGNTGLVVAKSLKFKFLGGWIEDVNFVKILGDLVQLGVTAAAPELGPAGPAVVWLADALSGPTAEVATSQLLDFEVSSQAAENSGSGGTDPVTEDDVIKVTDSFSLKAPWLKGVVTGKKQGVSAVQATFDMEKYCLGKASDLMFVIVIDPPVLERVEIRNEEGFVEDPLTMLVYDGSQTRRCSLSPWLGCSSDSDCPAGEICVDPVRHPHSVGSFNLLPSAVSIAFDPLGTSGDTLANLAKAALPGALTDPTAPELVLPPGATLDSHNLYPGGDFYFGMKLEWEPLDATIVLSQVRLQAPLPEIVPFITSWKANYNTPPIIDLTQERLAGKVNVKGLQPGTAQLEVDACFVSNAGINPFDFNGVRVLAPTTPPYVTVTPTPTQTLTPTRTSTATITRTPTRTGTATSTPTITRTPSVTATPAGLITGVKFYDLNGNGRKDAGEPRIRGWTIYIDANHDGVLNNPAGNGVCNASAVDPCALTDVNGSYALPVALGVYRVREVLAPRWRQTTADPSDLVVSASVHTYTDIDFGNRAVGDCNGDGAVTIDELLKMVSIALGAAQTSTCAAGDVDADNKVTIDEIIAAIDNVLAGITYRAVPPSPSATAPPITPSVTPTPMKTATPTRTGVLGSTPTPTRTATRTLTGTQTPTRTATRTPTRTPTPTRTRTFTPTRTPTRTPTTAPVAPVVTAFTCDGVTSCVLEIDESFTLQFSFTDANGNASNWHLTAERDDGTIFDMGQGVISPPSGGDTITRISSGFSCPSENCLNSQWQIHVVITDTTGLQSQPATVDVYVFGAIP